MKFLFDTSADKIHRYLDTGLVGGQLQTKTGYQNWSGPFGIDNNAFTGFDQSSFSTTLNRNLPYKSNCLFVACPDVVGSVVRTMEIWVHRHRFIPPTWPIALVAQDGIEGMTIQWSELDAIFIGGTNRFKDSEHAYNLVRTAKILGKHVHVGRVNGPSRYKSFAEIGADTCDGTGVSIYTDAMLTEIQQSLNHNPKTLFNHDNH